jgi:hypothetical protein
MHPGVAYRTFHGPQSIMTWTAILILGLMARYSHGFALIGSPLSRCRCSTSPSTITTRLDMASNSSMRTLFDELTSELIQRLNLEDTDFTETNYGCASWSAPTVSGTAEWLHEQPSPKYLTGVSFLTRQNNNNNSKEDGEYYTINVWMGPTYDCPHVLMTFGAQSTGNRYPVTLDYLPRGATPLGSDPLYLDKYYSSEDVQEAWETAYRVGTPLPPESAALETRLLYSPVRIAVTLDDAQLAEELIRGHLERFLEWLGNAQPIPARSRGSMTTRDDLLRQYYYRGQVIQNVAEFGDGLGNSLAAVNTGPVAAEVAYVEEDIY